MASTVCSEFDVITVVVNDVGPICWNVAICIPEANAMTVEISADGKSVGKNATTVSTVISNANVVSCGACARQ